MKKMIWFCLLGSGLMLSWSIVFAGDYLVIPVKGQVTSWDKIISGASRFQLVLNDEAVLDRETGLVWEKRPCWVRDNPQVCNQNWKAARDHCYIKEVGGRKGWRLPTIEELLSLIDMDGAVNKLPDGHPFLHVYSSFYWSSTTTDSPSRVAWAMHFGTGLTSRAVKDTVEYYQWCVRGGYGHDGHY